MKNKFIFIGDILLCVAVAMLCIECVLISGSLKNMGQQIEQLKTQVASLTDANTEIQYDIDNMASDTDAQIQSINDKLDKHQTDYEKLNKELQKNTEEEKKEEPEEVSKEVNEVVETYVAYDDAPVVVEKSEPEIEVIEEVESEPQSAPQNGYLGTYEITAYSWTGKPCADGVMPQEGVTAASNDPNLWHKWIYVDGIGDVYIHDTGGMGMGVIDIYMPSESDCVEWGRQTRDVYFSK